MRIISGRFGGRVIKSPRGQATHPMGERVREALFNSLGNLNGLTVWDAFAGSGAVGLEAASRGAQSVIATEINVKAYRTLKQNVNLLAADNVKAIRANCASWGRNNKDKRFDIIICDPPYHKMQLSTVFAQKRHLKADSLMVLSYPGRDDVPIADGVVVVDNRNYGDAALAFYRLA